MNTPMTRTTFTCQGQSIRWDHFDSLNSLADEPLERTTAHDIAGRDGRNSLEWFGIDGGIPAVVAAITTGWQEGSSKVASLELPSPTPAPTRKRVRQYGSTGYAVNMNRVNSGHLHKAWRQTRKGTGNGPRLITVIANVGASCGRRPEELLWRGVAYIALADALERAGYRLRIIAAESVTDLRTGAGRAGNEGLVLSATVKDYHHPVDIDALASSIALIGTKRWLWHRRYYPLTGTQSPSLGRCSDRPLEMACEMMRADGHTVITGPQSIGDPHAASEWVRRTITEICGEQD